MGYRSSFSLVPYLQISDGIAISAVNRIENDGEFTSLNSIVNFDGKINFAFDFGGFEKFGDHHNRLCLVHPNHSPKIYYRVWQWSLGRYVTALFTVVTLFIKTNRKIQTFQRLFQQNSNVFFFVVILPNLRNPLINSHCL